MIHLLTTTLIVLLAVSVAQENGDEVGPGSEAKEVGYDLKAGFLHKQRLDPVMYLLNEKLQNEGRPLDNYENIIDFERAKIKPYADKVRYDTYLQKKLADGKFPRIRDEFADVGDISPNILADQMGYELTDALKSKYESYDNAGGFGEKVSDSSLNEIVDFLLGLVNKEIVAKGKDQIPVPNMSEEFEKRVAFIKLHGKFEAEDGWFRNLSTVQRTGDVVATRRGADTLVVTCEVGLAVMQFGFQTYHANLAGLAVSGHMTGSVASSSVTVQVAATVDGGKCNVSLERLTMDRFDGLDVQLTGLGDMSWLLDSIAGWATRHFKDNIVSAIEDNLRKAVTDIIAKAHCSEVVGMLENLSGGGAGHDLSVQMV